jgi:hypothetical protein
VLGEDQVRTAAAVVVGVQLDRRERHGGHPAVEQHVVGEDDPLAVDDVVEATAEQVVGAPVVAPRVQLAAADAEVQRPLGVGPAVWHAEPALSQLGVGERLERLHRSLAEAPFDGEVVLTNAHLV